MCLRQLPQPLPPSTSVCHPATKTTWVLVIMTLTNPMHLNQLDQVLPAAILPQYSVSLFTPKLTIRHQMGKKQERRLM